MQQKKHLLVILLFSIAMLVGKNSSSQTPNVPVPIFKDWTFLAEGQKMIDISYRIVQCDNKAQIHLKVFNEWVTDQKVSFQIEIQNPQGEKIAREIAMDVSHGKAYTAECLQDDNLSNLKIDLPPTFYPHLIKVAVVFK